jgi:hypothetical protein
LIANITTNVQGASPCCAEAGICCLDHSPTESSKVIHFITSPSPSKFRITFNPDSVALLHLQVDRSHMPTCPTTLVNTIQVNQVNASLITLSAHLTWLAALPQVQEEVALWQPQIGTSLKLIARRSSAYV